ncbi:hypothetical protein J2S94_001257 [Arthrobacter bambusae]|nr:hypothetical protein [Arthrobacter bambusae]
MLIDNRVMDRDIYHGLPEHRDWDEIIRGDFAIVGRVQLSPDFLDLVIVSEADGDLRSAFIHRGDTRAKPKEVREFIDRCWNRARIITLQENRNKRSIKK